MQTISHNPPKNQPSQPSETSPINDDVKPYLDSITVIASASTENSPPKNTSDNLLDDLLLTKNTNAVFTDGWDMVSLRYYLQSVARDILDHNRLNACMRVPSPHALTIDVHRSEDGDRAHYRNLCCCANVWICPVCTVTVTMRRRQELATALANAGHYFYMATFTIQHLRAGTLKESLETLLKAYRNFTSGRSYQALAKQFGIVGTLKTLEVTYGLNGWHPHLHILYALLDRVDHIDLKYALGGRWQERVERLGGQVNINRAFDVTEADDSVSRYLAKYGDMPRGAHWSVEDEMTRTPAKSAKNGHLSPFEILLGAGNPLLPIRIRMWLTDLFQEYATGMKRRHQLQPSRSMRVILSLEPYSDEEIIQSEPLEYPLFAQLTRRQWDTILYNDMRGEILRLAKSGDETAFWKFIRELPPVPIQEQARK